LVIAQIILLLEWFSKKNLVKKTKQKELIKIVESKLSYPKWHFGQVGHGGKKIIWSFFDQNSQ
jgi:hypothetical protein